jgi:cardiolipin synthase
MFNPWFKRGITRTHRKICVVDREVAYVGGININDDMFCDYDHSKPLSAPRWDFAVQVHGPLVADIQLEAVTQWRRLGKLSIIKRIGLYRDMRKVQKIAAQHAVQAGFVVRDNLRNRRTIQRAYLQALGRRARACCWPIRISRRAASSAARWPPPSAASRWCC